MQRAQYNPQPGEYNTPMAIGRYLWAAFWTRYNLLALAAAVVGIFVWRSWFWLALLGAEVAYLLLLASLVRFRRVVDAQFAEGSAQRAEEAVLMQLRGDAQRSFRDLKRHCEATLKYLSTIAPGMVELHRQELARLGGVYLELLLTRQALQKTLDAAKEDSPATQAAAIDARLSDSALDADVRESVTAQRSILQQRQAAVAEAAKKVDFLNAETARIEQQVKLMRDQMALIRSPQQASEKITEITATLQGTTRWMSQQRELLLAAQGGAPVPPAVHLQSPLAQ